MSSMFAQKSFFNITCQRRGAGSHSRGEPDAIRRVKTPSRGERPFALGIQSQRHPVGGSFTTNSADFSPLIPAPGPGESTTNLVDSGGTTNAPARYYRIRLGP
jgi:hypothetical protein